MTITDSFRIVEIDRRLARGMRLEVRRIPVRADRVYTIVAADGALRIDLLAEELEDLILSEPEVAPVYAVTLGRLALSASRETDRDGMVEHALRFAHMAHRWAPDDPEVVANLAIAEMTNGYHRAALITFDAVLDRDHDGSLYGLRLLAARNALLADEPETALAALAPLERGGIDREEFRVLFDRARERVA
jgi:hypothetical protein